jgi:hypothetical protein
MKTNVDVNAPISVFRSGNQWAARLDIQFKGQLRSVIRFDPNPLQALNELILAVEDYESVA